MRTLIITAFALAAAAVFLSTAGCRTEEQEPEFEELQEPTPTPPPPAPVTDTSYRVMGMAQIPATLYPFKRSFLDPQEFLRKNDDPISLISVIGNNTGEYTVYSLPWRDYGGLRLGLWLQPLHFEKWAQAEASDLPDEVQQKLDLP